MAYGQTGTGKTYTIEEISKTEFCITFLREFVITKKQTSSVIKSLVSLFKSTTKTFMIYLTLDKTN